MLPHAETLVLVDRVADHCPVAGVPWDEAEQPSNGHRIPDGHRVVAVPILAGSHHEYGLEPTAA
jgi:hypothetical protein